MTVRPLSIFLLKVGRTADDSLDEPGLLEEAPMSGSFPKGSRFFMRRGHARKPWWLTYFGVDLDVLSQSNGAVAFVPTNGRVFALAFGSARHNLADDAYEHDFGTRVVLNCIDPEKLKSTDVLEPGSARRQRTQLPFDADLSYFGDLDDSTVMRSLTGKVGGAFAEIARSVTGAYNLRITTATPSVELVGLLRECLELSNRSDYIEKFPTLRWLEPVTDPEILKPLSEKMLDSIFDVNAKISLTIPEVVDYESEGLISFAGAGASDVFGDVYIKHYRQYLEGNGIDRMNLTVDQLKRHKLQLLDDEDSVRHSYSIFRSLVCEVSPDAEKVHHLSDGIWYRVDQELLDRLRSYLDPKWRASALPDYEDDGEGEYNGRLASLIGGYCLDKKSISLPGEHGVEPCDVVRLVGDRLELIHVKIGTTSDKLSHHFNQGVNSLNLLMEQEVSRERLEFLIAAEAGGSCPVPMKEALSARRFAVAFVIVTHKDQRGRSLNIPLFSRLSLRRQLRAINLTQTPATFEFVRDVTEAKIVRRRVGRRTPSAGTGYVTCDRCHLQMLSHRVSDGLCLECRG